MGTADSQFWTMIIAQVGTMFTGLIGVYFAAKAASNAKESAVIANTSKTALTEIHTVVNENFSKQREEIAAQAREIVNLRVVLANNVLAATQVEDTRKTLASETAAVLAAPPTEKAPMPVTVVTDTPLPVTVIEGSHGISDREK